MSEEWYRAPESELPRLRYYARKLQRHPGFAFLKQPINVAKSAISYSFRMATQQYRHLPTAVIVGAAKAGTTQLHAHLIKHPRCFSGAEKEVRYFSKYANRTVEWYRSRFPWRLQVERRKGHVVDSSPSYMPSPQALRQMKEVLPDARIIAILRDPTARAFSHYQHHKTRHKEVRSFDEAIADELRQNAFPPRLGTALSPDARPMNDYVARGYYALQLELLFTLYPRERVLVIDSADLFADTGATCRRVFDFLRLEACEVRPEKIYNRGYYREKIDPHVAERLRQHFRPYDELLTEIVGSSFSWMNDGSRARAA